MDEIVYRSVGRPTVINDDSLSKLKAILQRGLSIKRACIYAGIGEKTFYRHYSSDSEFRQQINSARSFVTLTAGEVVANDIVENKSVNTSKWWLERKEPGEFNIQVLNKTNNTQNNQSNYVFMTNTEFKKWADDIELSKMDPIKLVENLYNGVNLNDTNCGK